MPRAFFFSFIAIEQRAVKKNVATSPSLNLSKQDYRLTLIRGIALCRGAFSIVQCPCSLATQNPCFALAQTGRTLLLGSWSLFSSAAHRASPALLGPAVPAGCWEHAPKPIRAQMWAKSSQWNSGGCANENTALRLLNRRSVRHNQRCDCQCLPVSLCPPDSRLDSALLVLWLLCLYLGLELQGETSLSLEPVPERFFLAWAFCLSWVTSAASLELSMLWRLLFLQPCAFICRNRERWESEWEPVTLSVTAAAKKRQNVRGRGLSFACTQRRKRNRRRHSEKDINMECRGFDSWG